MPLKSSNLSDRAILTPQQSKLFQKPKPSLPPPPSNFTVLATQPGKLLPSKFTLAFLWWIPVLYRQYRHCVVMVENTWKNLKTVEKEEFCPPSPGMSAEREKDDFQKSLLLQKSRFHRNILCAETIVSLQRDKRYEYAYGQMADYNNIEAFLSQVGFISIQTVYR